MPFATNPISILLDAIFAMMNIAFAIVMSYAGTIALFVLVAGAAVVAALALVALLRKSTR